MDFQPQTNQETAPMMFFLIAKAIKFLRIHMIMIAKTTKQAITIQYLRKKENPIVQVGYRSRKKSIFTKVPNSNT